MSSNQTPANAPFGSSTSSAAVSSVGGFQEQLQAGASRRDAGSEPASSAQGGAVSPSPFPNSVAPMTSPLAAPFTFSAGTPTLRPAGLRLPAQPAKPFMAPPETALFVLGAGVHSCAAEPPAAASVTPPFAPVVAVAGTSAAPAAPAAVLTAAAAAPLAASLPGAVLTFSSLPEASPPCGDAAVAAQTKPPSRSAAPARPANASSPRHALTRSILRDDAQSVAAELPAIADAAAAVCGGVPLATLAAGAGATAALRTLLAAGVPPPHGALHAAAKAIAPGCVQALLSAGADVNARDARGVTPLAALVYAAGVAFGGAASVTVLSVGGGGLRPAATPADAASAAAALLQEGADVGAADAEGRTPLALAQRSSGEHVLLPQLRAAAAMAAEARAQAEAAEAEAQAARAAANAALRDAVLRCDAAAAATALAAGADARAAAGEDGTLGHVASLKHGTSDAPDEASFAALLRTLLLSAADLDARDTRGAAPLHMAVWRRATALAQALLERGADANAEVTQPKAAVPQGAWQMVVPSAPKKAPGQPMCFGAAAAAIEPAWGASPPPYSVDPEAFRIDAATINGGSTPSGARKPFQRAARLGSAGSKKATVMQAAGAPSSGTPPKAAAAPQTPADAEPVTPPPQAPPPGEEVMCETPIAAAADDADLPDAPKAGATPLSIAAAYGDIALVSLLLRFGARANSAVCGITPLVSAAFAGSAECVAALLAAGADPHITANVHGMLRAARGSRGPAAFAGFSALHAAALSENAAGGGACVTALIAAGADFNVASDQGERPLHVAARFGSEPAALVLLAAGADALAPALRHRYNTPCPVSKHGSSASKSTTEPELQDGYRLASAATHPGSWAGCGGNPAGIARCSGHGNCGSSCVGCGAGTYWSCCGSTDAFSLSCPAGISVKAAVANATSCAERAPAARKVSDIPGVCYSTSAADSNASDAATLVSEAAVPAVAAAAAHSPADAAARASAVLALQPGSAVCLSQSAADADVAEGPLQRGVMGTVIGSEKGEASAQRVVVRTPDGSTWAYPAAALAPTLHEAKPSSCVPDKLFCPLRPGVVHAHGVWRFARVIRPDAGTDELLVWRVSGEAASDVDFALRLHLSFGDPSRSPFGAAAPPVSLGSFWDGAHEWVFPANVNVWHVADGAARMLRAGPRPLYGDVAALARTAHGPLPALPLPAPGAGSLALGCLQLQQESTSGSASSVLVSTPCCAAAIIRLEPAAVRTSSSSSSGAAAVSPAAPAVKLLSATRTLPFAPLAAGTAPPAFIPGDVVVLNQAEADQNENTKGGPLKSKGPTGQVTEISADSGRVRVRAASDRLWWYDASALRLKHEVDEAPIRLGDRVGIWLDDERRTHVVVVAAHLPSLPHKNNGEPPDAPRSVLSAACSVQLKVRCPDGSLRWIETERVSLVSADEDADGHVSGSGFSEARAGDTAVHLAAAFGHAAILRAILQACGAPATHVWNVVGERPLHVAARADDAECVAALLEAGADPFAPKADGDIETPFHVAAKAGAAAALEALLASPGSVACLERHDLDGNSVRDLACSNAVRRLLNAAATAERQRAAEQARADVSLFEAAAADDVAALSAAAGAPALGARRATNGTERTLLNAACAAGAANAVTFLLADTSVDACAVDIAGATALHDLAAYAPAEASALIIALVSRGASVDAETKGGATPLLLAAARAEAANAFVPALLDAGAEVSARLAKDKRTALHAAAGVGAVVALAALLARGAEPDAAAADGSTPLHSAAACCIEPAACACVAALLKASASPLVRDAAGRAPADAAATAAAREVLRSAAAAAAKTDPSARWLAEKGRPGAQACPALDELMALTGLFAVKAQALALYHAVRVVAERHHVNGDATASLLSEMCLHMRFDGNPGSGKTTVARLMGAVLLQLGVVPPGTPFVERGGAGLLSEGPAGLTTLLEGELAGGGVLFIDEAYQLAPKTDRTGAQVVHLLLKSLEDVRDKLVCIVAGYGDLMDELMSFNPGLPSRFPHTFVFEDFGYAELLAIMRGMLAARRYRASAVKPLRIAARRLAAGAGAPGFGNGRAVRSYLETAIRRQQERLALEREQSGGNGALGDAVNVLTAQDLLGPRPADPASLPAVAELEGMVGLGAVKSAVRSLLALLVDNARREDAEAPPLRICLHRLFLGSPGTGKTTVAALYGRILKDLGWLSKGDLVLRTPADFTGTVVGESEQRTRDILAAARGKVLVIDEAYGLNDSSPYMKAVVDTIVSKVQAVPGDDIAVLLLGYKDEIEEMLRTSNPGLARRFRPDDAFIFEDYDDDALRTILLSKAASAGLTLPAEAADAAVALLARQRQKKHFGNGGAVENLLTRAKEALAARVAHASFADEGGRATLIADDFAKGAAPPPPPEAALAHLVGADVAHAKLAELRAAVAAAAAAGSSAWSAVEACMVITGPPGCGKTTLARALGAMYCSLGLLAEREVVERSASTLQTGYVGQAGGKVRAVLDEALGRVLLIDNAPQLGATRGTFNAEIVAELATCLGGSAKYANKLLVVLAGETDAMDAFLARTHPGLAARFTERIDLQAWSPEAAAAVVAARATDAGCPLSAAAADAVQVACAALAAAPGWGSGRDAEALAKRAVRKAAQRRAAAGDAAPAAATERADVMAAAAEMLAQPARSAAAVASRHIPAETPDPMDEGGWRPPPAPPRPSAPPKLATATAQRVAAAKAGGGDGDGGDHDGGLWSSLERACIACGIMPADVLPELRAGRPPERVVPHVARELGASEGAVRAMLAEQAPALAAQVEAALAAAAELQRAAAAAAQAAAQELGRTRNLVWVCSYCHNSNPDCPYRARQQGGYFLEL